VSLCLCIFGGMRRSRDISIFFHGDTARGKMNAGCNGLDTSD
jgi:hypothetical protein